MNCPVGSIIHIKEFVLKDGSSKGKFFIVLDNSDDFSLTLLSMSTSNESGFYFNIDDVEVKHGAIADSNGNVFMYCIPKNHIIGIHNGFKFKKDTFFISRYCLNEFDCEQIGKFDIEICDEISNEELNNLVYTLYKSKYLVKDFKIKLESILANLNP